MPGTKVFLSTLGRAVDPSDATISVFDRGFLYGDSVYETMRTSGGIPVEFGRHIDRLAASGEGIGLQIPFGTQEIRAAVDECHAQAGNEESYVRVIVTRGAGPIALDPRASHDPTLVILVQPLVIPSVSAYERGIAAVLVHVDKGLGGLLDPALKTGNYLANILAVREAIARRGDDAILCNGRGEITEAATSNVFAVFGGRVRTPPLQLGLLAGITRVVVCELAVQGGRPIEEAIVTAEDLRRADEVFLTSSVRGIMPVTSLDGSTVGAGRIGSITRSIRAVYDDYLSRYRVPAA